MVKATSFLSCPVNRATLRASRQSQLGSCEQYPHHPARCGYCALFGRCRLV